MSPEAAAKMASGWHEKIKLIEYKLKGELFFLADEWLERLSQLSKLLCRLLIVWRVGMLRMH